MPSFSSMEVGPEDPGFPVELLRLPRPVARLWYAGRLPEPGQRRLSRVSIVGSRAATRSACDRASAFASALVQSGHAVISGGALGIDAAAHRGALAGGGPTFAVLGCGVDVVYPDRHGPLYEAIIEGGGGLLTEYPPGTPPKSGHFPVRNRIVTALAEAVVVVEAQPRSGALITARLAGELGRRLFAVPGSPGTDALVTSGRAVPVVDPAALLAALDGAPVGAPEVPAELAPLVAALRVGPAAASELATRMSVPLPEALGRLVEAELAGWAHRLPGGRFEVPRAS